ncbi:tyrosine-type recombinase/integrase [Nocardioides sp. NPDC047086]|uniref:tyrosine-type recombinase/integrase n=1 Tax=Nocardioides sp. NPDC047086 TaxID=3154810 RepID=UPI0033CEF228
MSVHKTPSGRYRAFLKSGREVVATKTFDTQREAKAWLTRERAALVGGVDPRAGKRRVRELLTEWLVIRRTTVAKKTFRADQALERLMPTSMFNMQVASVSERDVARSFERLLADGQAGDSVVRYRASLSVFFSWCVRERYIMVNPVTGAKVPKQSDERTEMNPFPESDLEAAYEVWQERNKRLADILLVLGWTGLRWGEARAMTVSDVMEIPTPGLMVRRSRSEGIETKSTKGRRSRRVPLANRVLPIVRGLTIGKQPSDPLFTTDAGALLHRGSVVRTMRWEQTGQGRRLHDLRHTAACLWLARGVDVGTVQQWMGHESIATTNRYLHFLGTGADRAGLERLNEDRGYAGGTRDEGTGE